MKSLSYLNKYFLKYKWRFILGIIFLIGSNYYGALMPEYVQNTVNNFTDSISDKNPENLFILTLKIGGIYLLLSLISGFFTFLTRQTIIIMSRLIEFDLKNEIYAQYQRLGFNFYKKNNTGDLMNRISEDVGQVRQYLGPGVMYTVNLVIMSVFVIYKMAQISGFITLLALIPLPLMSFLIYKVSSRMNFLSKKVQEEQSLLSTIAQETFSGIRVIKAYNRFNEVSARFNDSSETYKQKTMRLVFVNALFLPTVSFLIGISTITAIYFGGLMAFDDSHFYGNIVALVMYINKLTWPFASIGWVTTIIQRASASQERINEFLKIEPEIKSDATTPFDFQGEIEFKNVSIVYPNSQIQALKNLNFKVKKGETLAVLGRTGSGKTTILNLIMRQLDPQEGEIRIDGQNLKDINLHDFREQTGIVPQEVFLFSDSIKNNIAFGAHENVSESEIEESTRKSYVYHNIEDFPDKFETLLGERGVNLSGGQKQRISIARALVRHPKLLILDDCLSAVDTETEEKILSNLKRETASKTAIIVSHRISSIRNADHIIVLENGEKKEEGTHDSLLAKNGLYADMYHKQLTEDVNPEKE